MNEIKRRNRIEEKPINLRKAILIHVWDESQTSRKENEEIASTLKTYNRETIIIEITS